jgi:hypothetical protein
MATQGSLFASVGAVLTLPVPVMPTGNSAGGDPPPSSPTVPIRDPGVDLARKTVCIKVRLSTMGNTRKVSTSQIEADADKDLLRVSKFRRVIAGCLVAMQKWFVCCQMGRSRVSSW